MSCHQLPLGDCEYGVSDNNQLSPSSRLAVRMVSFSSESSSEVEYWNTFVLFKFSTSNQNNTSSPKKVSLTAKMPNPTQTPKSPSKSQKDTSASLSLQKSTPQKLSTSYEEVNLEKNCNKLYSTKEVEERVDGSVIQNATVTPADITPQKLISIRNSKQHNLDKNYLNKEVNLAIPKPLGEASFVPTWSKNDSRVVKELVDYRYRDTYAELMDRLKRQRLVSAEARLKIAACNNRPLSANMHYLKYIDDSSDGKNMNLPNTNSDSSKASQNKPVEVKDNSFASETANSIEELDGVNPHLLALKLQALKEETEANHDCGYSGSISSENEEDQKKIILNVEAHIQGQESQKTMENVGEGNIQKVDENMEIMETQKHENVEQNENTIREAEQHSNQSKMYLTSEFNESSFLRTAIGEKLMKYMQKSVDTIEVSHYLISMDYIKTLEKTLFPNRTFKSYSSCPDFTIENTRCTYPPSCEEVSGFGFNTNTDEGQEFVKKHIEINEKIVNQLTKMLVFGCQNQPQFLGSELHLEGEKMLLIAKTRWDALVNHLQRVAEPAGGTFAQIMLENFSCQINFPKYEQFPPNVKHYYICVLEHKTTVYSTSIKEANEYGYINFGDRFIFENVTNTFDIKISLYSLRVKLPKRQCMKFCEMRRRSQAARMTLIGLAQIGLLNVKHRKFPFENLANVNGPEHQLLTTVETTLNWPKPVKGFLTMGFSQSDRQPIWQKRWCVLEAGKLRYFNFPSDELYSSPIGVVDVSKCASIENSPFKYMMRKPVMLTFHTNQNEVMRMFICADNNVDQMMWLEAFNASIKINNDWRLLQTEAIP